MKTGLFLAAALVQIAAAQPHRNLHGHQHAHEKKDVVVATDVEYVTATAPDVVVYVNAAGVPVSTVTKGVAAPTAAPAAPAASYVAAKPVVAAPPAVVTSAAAAAPPAAAAPVLAAKKPSAASSASSSEGSGFAIAYSPYTASGDCKSQDQVNSDFEKLGSYNMVRIYGTDCNQVTTVGNAAKAAGMKLFAGIFDINSVQSEAQTIIDACNGDFSHIDTISVGNELVNNGEASPEQVIAALSQARSQMNAAGYTGSMVTVDTFNAIIANPSLCQASDYAAANAHAFFDPTLIPSGSGVWAAATALAVKAACGGKRTVITESGFPSAGECNGSMCPSLANQATAISSLRAAFPNGGLILFSAYNDLWKTLSPSTFDAEQSYGIYGTSSSG